MRLILAASIVTVANGLEIERKFSLIGFRIGAKWSLLNFLLKASLKMIFKMIEVILDFELEDKARRMLHLILKMLHDK